MAMKHEVSTPQIVVSGIIGVVLLVELLIATTAWFRYEEQAEMARYENTPVMSLATLNLEQQTRINTTRWVDQEKGIVAIPIDEAMQVLVRNQGKMPTTRPAQAAAQ